ncbi:thrombospondin type-1 domain-containing protein 7A-like [Sesbania bispinosa]|nr:thrombospondin type-1 domain-containing protein 7A-like [Sesbania bispinosa]
MMVYTRKQTNKYAEEAKKHAIDKHRASKKPRDILYEFQQLQEIVKQLHEGKKFLLHFERSSHLPGTKGHMSCIQPRKDTLKRLKWDKDQDEPQRRRAKMNHHKRRR